MARRCWAACLGGCSRKITEEHIVSKSVFISDVIATEGFPWSRQAPKVIPKKSFTSKILCLKHNNELSHKIDPAGKHAFSVFRKLAELDDQRIQAMNAVGSQLPFDVVDYSVDGLMLERWFMKTLINIEVVGKQGIPIGPYQSKASEPPQELVEIAFGQKQFENGAGLYSLSREGQDIYLEERVRCAIWLRDWEQATYVAAAEFWFYGYTFFLNLGQVMMPRVFQLGKHTVNLRHRPAIIPSRLYGKLSQRINFKW